jgi:hypothetical protein
MEDMAGEDSVVGMAEVFPGVSILQQWGTRPMVWTIR